MEWRTIAEFPAYEVSSMGDVRRSETGAVLKCPVEHSGYRRVTFSVPGRKVYRLVHRLVARAFLAPDQSREIVCHRDGDRMNNTASNLYYGTHAENRADAVRHGTAANSGPRFTRSQRDIIRLAARTYNPAALTSMFGISPAYARLVRARAIAA